MSPAPPTAARRGLSPFARALATALASLLLWALAGGCGPPAVEGLDILSFDALRVRSVDGDRLRLTARVELRNDTGRTARVRDLAFRWGTTDTSLGRGSVGRELALEPDEVWTERVDLDLDLGALGPRDLEALLAPRIPYRVDGRVTVVGAAGKVGRDVDVRLAGTLEGPDRLRLDVPADVARRWLSWSGAATDLAGLVTARAVVQARLVHPLAFPLDVDELAYEVRLEGRRIGDGRLRNLRLLPGANALELPVQGRPGGLAGGVLDALGSRLRGGGTDLAVTGRLTVRGEGRDLEIVLH